MSGAPLIHKFDTISRILTKTGANLRGLETIMVENEVPFSQVHALRPYSLVTILKRHMVLLRILSFQFSPYPQSRTPYH